MSFKDAAKQGAQQALMRTAMKVIALAPDRLMPGATPDPVIAANKLTKDSLIGKALSRLDGPDKAAGRALFAAEHRFDGLTYAAIAFSTIARGRIVTLHTSSAEQSDGVLLVMSFMNAPKMAAMPLSMDPNSMDMKAAGGDKLAVMQDDRIVWNGQPIAVVVAETQEQADHAATLIAATYETQDAVTSFAAAGRDASESGRMLGMTLKRKIGDAERALGRAAFAVDFTYQTPNQNHNAIEPHACTVKWEGEQLFVHDASQAVAHTAYGLAEIFGLKEEQVTVTSPFVGGAFGGKMLWQHQVLAAAAARLLKRPVRMTLSREGVYRIVGGRAMTEQRLAIGADAGGNFEALIHTGWSATTRRNQLPEAFMHSTPSMYESKTFSLDNQLAYLDILPNTQMRAPGGAVGSFALESAIDELAHKMGIDPVALRIKNEPDADQADGKPFSSRHAVEAWRAGAARFGWQQRTAAPGHVRDGEWLVGIGCAAASHPYIRMPGGAARLTLHEDGGVVVKIAAHEMGMGTATAQTQIIASRLGVPFEAVTFKYGDSRFPGLVLAAGSQQTASIGASVTAAFKELVLQLLKLAGKDSPLAGLKPEQVGGRNGGLADLRDPGKHESYGALLHRAGLKELSAEGKAPMPFELMHWAMHSTGALFCEVGVSAVTGEVRIRRFLGYFDCGKIINPKTAASQLRGGIIMGLGLALMEETLFDERTGRIINPNLSDYHIPVHLDVPDIDVAWTDTDDPRAPMGAHGIGELGTTGTAAAVANAIYNATGKRIRSLPITLDKLL